MNWNQELFFKINKLIGTNKWLDAFGRAGGEFLIFFSVAWYIGTSIIYFDLNLSEIFFSISFLALFWVLGLVLSLLIALIVKEPRPHKKFPDSKLLFKTLSDWKSFPSDHTLAGFLCFFIALIFGFPFAWVLLFFALWISWGRVYGGVHYPFDVVGGLALSGLVGVGAWYTYLLIF